MLQLSYLSMNAVLYLISGFSNDFFVDSLPTMFYHLTLRGYTRKTTDLACLLTALIWPISVIIFFDRKNQKELPLSKAFKGTSSTEIRLNDKQLEKLRIFSIRVHQIFNKVIKPLFLLVILLSTTLVPAILVIPESKKPLWFWFLIQFLFVSNMLILMQILFEP